MPKGCVCTIDMYVEYPPVACFKQYMRKAVKPHKCFECNRAISIGEVYEYSSAIWDGKWGEVKTCKECAEIRNCYCCSYNFGELWDAINEEFRWNGDWNLCILDGLTKDAKQVMIDYLQDIIDEDDE